MLVAKAKHINRSEQQARSAQPCQTIDGTKTCVFVPITHLTEDNIKRTPWGPRFIFTCGGAVLKVVNKPSNGLFTSTNKQEKPLEEFLARDGAAGAGRGPPIGGRAQGLSLGSFMSGESSQGGGRHGDPSCLVPLSPPRLEGNLEIFFFLPLFINYAS